MEIDGDILELLKDIPEAMADQTVTTEFKFMTLGAVLLRCSDEIIKLRKELHDATAENTDMRRVQTKVRKS